MFLKILQAFIVVAGLLVAAAVAWQQWGTHQGNKLVDEANELIQAASAATPAAVEKFKAVTSDENLAAFPGNRAQLEPQAREAAGMFAKIGEQYQGAAAKLTEASQQNTDEKVVAYWKLLAQQFGKSAERIELVRQFVMLPTDAKLETQAALEARQAEINTKLDEVMKREDELEAQAGKIKAEYPDLLK
jgi:hypothetical protein